MQKFHDDVQFPELTVLKMKSSRFEILKDEKIYIIAETFLAAACCTRRDFYTHPLKSYEFALGVKKIVLRSKNICSAYNMLLAHFLILSQLLAHFFNFWHTV